MCVALPLAAIGGDVRPEQPAGSAANVVTYTVSIANMQFEPAELSVKRGSRIVWVNKDLFRHTATAKDGTFDIDLPAGARGTIIVKKTGAIAILCRFHPGMRAMLKVGAN